ncbi:TPM domain-containing protein [Pedobacter rhodius]|uniref:TPM domain-containing protein n=1 Tax=Pedobacter rhodius TaxID=3004098 RepID=A0ABT4KT13_9SPHI|nr:TPM domain-containing protein [Pedobacter sp. SJ11]MCZ4222071.1 TPM domain-containing protein [Pedobacter sp. SJ11]
MQNNLPLKTVLLFVLILFSNALFAQKAYLVSELPDPKQNGGGWVSNPDGILNESDVAGINSTITELESKTNVQLAVVIVNDFDHNQEDFDFAYKLFSTWGIGQKSSNNGVLLFIAKDRRKYRFITGTGAEGVLPDVKLKHIAEQNLLPAFRENDFSTGIINTLNAMGLIILNPENKSELNQLFTQQTGNNNLEKLWIPTAIICLSFFGLFRLLKRYSTKKLKPKKTDKNDYNPALIKGCAVIFIILIFITIILFITGGFSIFKEIKPDSIPLILFCILSISLFFRYLFLIDEIRKTYNDDENFSDAVKSFHQKYWWLIAFSPLILFAVIRQVFRRKEANNRFKPILDSKQQAMIRLDRDINVEGKPFLTEGQRKEEIIKAYDYDIWESTDHKEHIIKAWPAEKYDQFTECPSCKFRTYQLEKQVTVKTATYTHDGQAKLINECSFCKHAEFIRWITLPMLVKESPRSSSGSSSSGSSSSSSSWGGGSSSGGGTGGSW